MPRIKPLKECGICDRIRHPLVNLWKPKPEMFDDLNLDPLQIHYETIHCPDCSELLKSDLEFEVHGYVDEDERKDNDGHAGA